MSPFSNTFCFVRENTCCVLPIHMVSSRFPGPRSGVRRNEEYLAGERKLLIRTYLMHSSIGDPCYSRRRRAINFYSSEQFATRTLSIDFVGFQVCQNSNQELSVTPTRYFVVVQPSFGLSNDSSERHAVSVFAPPLC